MALHLNDVEQMLVMMGNQSAAGDATAKTRADFSSAAKTAGGLETEYYLEGSVLDTPDGYGMLVQRLAALCDNSGEPFNDHYVHMVLPAQPTSVHIRVVRSLLRPLTAHRINYLGDFAPLGQNDNPYTSQRPFIDIVCSHTSVDFLRSMGFQPRFEYVFKGLAFVKGYLRINVGKMYAVSYDTGKTAPGTNLAAVMQPQQQPQQPPITYRTDDGRNVLPLKPLTNSHSIELSTIRPYHDVALAREMRLFGDLLKPMVSVEPVSQEFRKFA